MSASNKSIRPEVESLEGRALMSAGVTGTFGNGVLKLNGTAGNDTITLRQSGSKVTIDGFSKVLEASQVKRIEISAGAGKDVVNLQISPALAAKVFANGGGGIDTMNSTGNVGSMAGFEYGTRIAPPATSTIPSAGTLPLPRNSTPKPPASLPTPSADNGQFTNAGNRPWVVTKASLKDFTSKSDVIVADFDSESQARAAAYKLNGDSRMSDTGKYYFSYGPRTANEYPASPPPKITGTPPKVNYNGHPVSDVNVRAVLSRIASVLGRDVTIISGDRVGPVKGSSSTSLHLQARAVDFRIKGLSDSDAATLILRYHTQIFDAGNAYEFIRHGVYTNTNTGVGHLHIGHYGPGHASGIYFKHEGVVPGSAGQYVTHFIPRSR